MTNEASRAAPEPGGILQKQSPGMTGFILARDEGHSDTRNKIISPVRQNLRVNSGRIYAKTGADA
jgi:hypothetical protein